MHNTSYIIKFTLVMTVIVALVLSLLVSGLKETHMENESVYNKKGILSAVAAQLGKDIVSMPNEEVQSLFANKIEQKVINMKGEVIPPEQVKKSTGANAPVDIDWGKESKKPEAERLLPVFTFKADDNKVYNILYVRGKGLWDEIWGYIALENDWNTIAGQAFDHKGETPGLGAEIKDNKGWYGQFTGKKIYDSNGKYQSISVVKGGIKIQDHQVDAISGATITGNGVDEMLYRGLKYYEPFISKNKK